MSFVQQKFSWEWKALGARLGSLFEIWVATALLMIIINIIDYTFNDNLFSDC